MSEEPTRRDAADGGVPPEEAAVNRKTKEGRTVGRSRGSRFLLTVLLILSVTFAVLCRMGMEYLPNGESAERVIGRELLCAYLESGIQSVNEYCRGTNICYAIYTVGGRRVGGNMSASEEKTEFEAYRYQGEAQDSYLRHQIENYKIRVYFSENVAGIDIWPYYSKLIKTLEPWRFLLPLGEGVGILLAALFAFLLFRRGSGSILGRIPLEWILLAAAGGIFLCGRQYFLARGGNFFSKLSSGRYIVLIAMIVTVLCVHLINRFRGPEGLQNSYCYKYRVKFCYLWKRIRRFFAELPLVWKAVVGMLLLGALEVLVMYPVYRSIQALPYSYAYVDTLKKAFRVLVYLWIAEKIILVPFVLWLLQTMKKLRRMAAELARGNLEYRMDEKLLPRVFRGFGRDLNAATDTISAAVEHRLKSERLKTELITNVSHDIKTPLTSIINFADLIYHEKTDNPKVTEYAGLLHKQATRLKKLMEDLIEASKASTGNVEVHPEPCEVRVLLAQCLGEYEQRLSEQGISMVVKLGEPELKIMADSKLLWRIFENLMSNICKYSQRETRVYLTMERQGEKVRITFKNISRYELDVTSEELMERFVRGDMSRHQEGNGLGLSIVKSLMDLLGGEIFLVIDGDLFKAILEFPVYCGEEAQSV